MKTLSLCMIVKNEEKVLDESLRNAKIFADEIVLVDTGSTDSTVEIAKKYTDKIYFFEWINDFSAAQNYSLSRIITDYFFKWDADFVVTDENAELIRQLKEKDFDNANLIYLNWITEYGDFAPRKFVTRPLIAKTDSFHFESPIHTTLIPNEGVQVKPIVYKDICVLHKKDLIEKKHRYIQTESMVEKELKKNPSNSRLTFFYGEEMVHKKDFAKAIDVFFRYLDLVKYENSELSAIAIEQICLCFLHLGKIDEAFKLTQKYFKLYEKYPKYLLITADILSITDAKAGYEMYKRYLDGNYDVKDFGSYDIERNYVHPRMMAAENSPKELAIKYLEEAFNHTTLKETKNLLQHMLNKFK